MCRPSCPSRRTRRWWRACSSGRCLSRCWRTISTPTRWHATTRCSASSQRSSTGARCAVKGARGVAGPLDCKLTPHPLHPPPSRSPGAPLPPSLPYPAAEQSEADRWIPGIMGEVFECTLAMITPNFVDHPDIREAFFRLLQAMNKWVGGLVCGYARGGDRGVGLMRRLPPVFPMPPAGTASRPCSAYLPSRKSWW